MWATTRQFLVTVEPLYLRFGSHNGTSHTVYLCRRYKLPCYRWHLKEVRDQLQVTTIDLNAYCSKWRLTLNTTKCKVFAFEIQALTLKELQNVIEIEGTTVQAVQTYKFLGVAFNDKLSFKTH